MSHIVKQKWEELWSNLRESGFETNENNKGILRIAFFAGATAVMSVLSAEEFFDIFDEITEELSEYSDEMRSKNDERRRKGH